MTNADSLHPSEKRLVALNFAFADTIQELLSDAAVSEWTRIPHPYPVGAAREFIRGQIAQRAAGIGYSFAILGQGALVGVCGLMEVELGRGELGYWIGRPYWGHGYASFAVGEVLRFAFDGLKLDAVSAHALETNVASRRVLEKSGFHFTRLAPHNDPAIKRPNELMACYCLFRDGNRTLTRSG